MGQAIVCDRSGFAKYRKCRSLKVWTQFFGSLKDGSKAFEVRAFEAGEECEVGELLLLDEYDNSKEEKTGQSLLFEVTYTLKLADSDLEFCLPFPKTGNPVWVLGIRPFEG